MRTTIRISRLSREQLSSYSSRFFSYYTPHHMSSPQQNKGTGDQIEKMQQKQNNVAFTPEVLVALSSYIKTLAPYGHFPIMSYIPNDLHLRSTSRLKVS